MLVAACTVTLAVLNAWLFVGGRPHSFLNAPVRQWLAGGPLYSDILAYPFNSAAYGFMDYALLAVGWLALGEDGGSRAAQVFSVLAWTGTALGAAYSAGARGASLVVALGVVGTFLPTTSIADRLGASMEAVALITWLRFPGMRGALLAACVAGAATLGKQSYVAAAAGLALAEWLAGERRRAVMVAAVSASTQLLITAAVNAWSGGAYLQNLQYIAADDWHSAWASLGHVTHVLPALAPVVFLAPNARNKPVPRQLRALVCVSVCAFGVALLGSSKVGASTSYFAGFMAWSAALAAVLVHQPPVEHRHRLALLACGALLLANVPSRDRLSAWKGALLFRGDAEVLRIRAVLAQLPEGPLLSEDIGWGVASGRELMAHDPHTVRRSVESGRSDGAAFMAAIEQRRPAVIIMNARPFPHQPSFLFHVDLDEASRRFSCTVWRNYQVHSADAEHVILVRRTGPPPGEPCAAETLPWW